MGIGTGGPNQDLMFLLMRNALKASHGLTTYWSIERRHPDGRRWIELATFASRADAEAAMAAAVESGHAAGLELRIHRTIRAAD
jgi:hypothetical protein